MFESGAEIAAGGILALLLIREVLSFVRSYTAKKNGQRSEGSPVGNPGHIDVGEIESKLDRLSSAIDGLRETLAKVNRTIDDLQHSGDKTRQILGDVQETLRFLEKAERGRN